MEPRGWSRNAGKRDVCNDFDFKNHPNSLGAGNTFLKHMPIVILLIQDPDDDEVIVVKRNLAAAAEEKEEEDDKENHRTSGSDSSSLCLLKKRVSPQRKSTWSTTPKEEAMVQDWVSQLHHWISQHSQPDMVSPVLRCQS